MSFLFRTYLRRSVAPLAWSRTDAESMERILGGISDDGVPQVGDVIKLLSKAMDPAANDQAELSPVMLDPGDLVLTDALRCLMAHQWLAPSVQRKNQMGEMITSFFVQPHEDAQKLSLFSSRQSFERLQHKHALSGTILKSVPRTFGQVLMIDLPPMSWSTLQKQNLPEKFAVRALALDPEPLVVTLPGKEAPGEEGLVLLESAFPLLRNFCESFVLAGEVLRIDEQLRKFGAASVDGETWKNLFYSHSLLAILAGGAVFTTDAGLLLFCYPGDGSKVLSYHRSINTQGLETGKVLPIEPAQILDLLKWQAGRDASIQIVTAVVAGTGEPRCHGLSITADVFRSSVLPGLSQSS